MSCPLTRPELTADLVKGARKGAVTDGSYAHGMACECTPLVTACNKRVGVISGFRRRVNETRVLLGYYAAYSVHSLPTFRDICSIFKSQEFKISLFLSVEDAILRRI
jgi:hypothetical protein